MPLLRTLVFRKEHHTNKTILIPCTSSGHGRPRPSTSTRRAGMSSRQCERRIKRPSSRSSSACWSPTVDAALAKFGPIDALVNNAGHGAYGPLEATPIEKIRRQFEVNVLGLLATTQALLPHFRTNRSGTIVNVSSVGGRMAFPLSALYHGTKFAVEGLSESLHYELAPLEPGGMKTDFGGRSLDLSNDPNLTA
jgi:NAD(P)-dependent dehydrogenase (short-subunit alcohol dehydrogenase family)